jgi:hypothetical protein
MLLPMLEVLYFYTSAFQSMCAAPSVVVSCSSLILCFPDVAQVAVIVVVVVIHASYTSKSTMTITSPTLQKGETK